MPVSYDMFQLATCYMTGQIYAVPNPTIETVYEKAQRIEKADYNIKNSYIPKIAYRLVPNDCKTIVELSQTVRGDQQTSYSNENHRETFECSLYSTLQQSKEACISHFLTLIPQEQQQQACKGIYFKKIKLPKGQKGKMVQIKANIFGKSIIEPLVLKYFIKMYKTNFKNLFQDYAVWSKLNFEDCDALRQGKQVKSVDLNQYKEFDKEQKEVESSSSRSDEFDLNEKQREECSAQAETIHSQLSFDANSF